MLVVIILNTGKSLLDAMSNIIRPIIQFCATFNDNSNLIYKLFNLSGNYSSFMQKEIFEQPESVVNTMRGRVNMASGSGNENN